MKRSNRPRRTSAQRRKLATVLGGLFTLFAVIGIISAALWGFDEVRGLFDNSAKRSRYESFISPVVMTDPAPFTMVENLEDDLVMQASLWAALMGENRSSYSYDENGLLLVPASDVNVAAAKLFGPEMHIIHRSFDDNDASYLFDPEISAYRVPTINKLAYSPSVTEITQKNDTVVLKVGYVAPGNIWSTDPQNDSKSREPTPEKYMLYTLTKWEQGYYISSVTDVDANAVPMS